MKHLLGLAVAALAGVGALLPETAMAQERRVMVTIICAPEAYMKALITKKYQETPVGAGIINQGVKLEIYSSGKSFSMLTTKDGVSCLRLAGEALELSVSKPGQET